VHAVAEELADIFPAAQFEQALAAATEYVPAAQTSQESRPTALAYLPATQLVHSACPVDAANLPVTQSAQALEIEPVEETALPTMQAVHAVKVVAAA